MKKKILHIKKSVKLLHICSTHISKSKMGHTGAPG